MRWNGASQNTPRKYPPRGCITNTASGERRRKMLMCQTCLHPITEGHFKAMILGENFYCHVGCEPIFYYQSVPNEDQMKLPLGEEVKPS